MARPQKYPWHEIFDNVIGSRLVIRTLPGYDFDCSPENWQKQVLDAARRRGFHVTTELRRNGEVWVKPAPSQRRDWDHIFDGRRHYWDPARLRVRLDSLRVTISRQAKARNVTYRTTVHTDGYFYVQATTRDGVDVRVPLADQPVACPHAG